MRANRFKGKEKPLRAAPARNAACLAEHFANASAAKSAAADLQSLLSSTESKNLWRLAALARLQSPYRFQHLLGRGGGETGALRGEGLGAMLSGLGAARTYPLVLQF